MKKGQPVRASLVFSSGKAAPLHLALSGGKGSTPIRFMHYWQFRQ